MTFSFKKIAPHLVVVLIFIITALLYFSPVLSGKKMFQSDIQQYRGMAKEQMDFRAATGEEPYWTDAAFGGMPTYQLGAKYPYNWIKSLDLSIRFLPRPADYLFLYFIGFYVLLLVLKLDWKYAGLGALAFGFSSYLIIILGVGHNAKAHAIAYMPLVLSGILLTFRKKYIWGFILTTVAMALEIVANHVQMTYYLMLLVLVLGVAYLIDAFRKNELPHFFKSVGILVLAVVLAIGTNAASLMATSEYSAFSTRGKSDLTINPDGTPKTDVGGLDKEYINQYSYGISETLDLFIAGLYGGSNSEPYDKDSAFTQFLLQQGVPPPQVESIFGQFGLYYWGSQPGVSGPAYLGAVVVFLFVLGIFMVKGRLKWWLLGGTILSLLLSFGSNLSWFTDLWIDYFPLYNKFRAVTSIQVIAEICVPVLAVFGLYKILQKTEAKEDKLKALKWTTGITGGLSLIILLFNGSLFSFAGGNDAYYIQNFGMDFISAVKEDRKSLLVNDTLKTLILVLIAAGLICFYIKQKVSEIQVILVMAILIVFDLVQVDRRYVNTENFMAARLVEQPFQASEADKQILQDTSRYRVFEQRIGLNGARTSYFHNSIGGYHGAKPARLQELAEFYLYQGNIQPLNLLNVKYIISQDEEGAEQVQQNPQANGNVWFVQNVKVVPDADAEILALDSLNTLQTAVIQERFANDLPRNIFPQDSTDNISLVEHQPNYLKYQSSAQEAKLAVFSEVYYPDGWNVYIDGKPSTYFKADYILRAMMVPEGEHTIEFKFEPQVVKTGSTISLASNILLILIIFGGVFFTYRKLNSAKTE
ncbi:YfhO family protein [Leeuwenhoekiella palythoae]|uniref:Membrane protein YfhO n=1 Tax=Leeuwenhoekiella palythoae TaxID=573501 RepID=A0A1M5SHZ3_9FLAO|nr:YfhO family protein [Leeuwenhoekiella palythoae]RXG28963.1 membrane protein YfhO [Leeuwenhoekiella palythoae]SHH37888.1 membrane protein YfhO [Leeuwenhoekiella palythoae]